MFPGQTSRQWLTHNLVLLGEAQRMSPVFACMNLNASLCPGYVWTPVLQFLHAGAQAVDHILGSFVTHFVTTHQQNTWLHLSTAGSFIRERLRAWKPHNVRDMCHCWFIWKMIIEGNISNSATMSRLVCKTTGGFDEQRMPNHTDRDQTTLVQNRSRLQCSGRCVWLG